MNTSNQNKSAFKIRVMAKIKEQKMVIIFNIAMQILGLPLFAVLSAWGSNIMVSPEKNTASLYMFTTLFCTITFLAALISVLYLVPKNFSYLHRKNLTDMNMALPLTRSQLFAADYLAGLAVYVIPFFISAFITLIITSANGGVFSPSAVFSSMYGTEPLPYAISLSQLISYLMQICLTLIMAYNFSVLITVCCGSVSESVIYTCIMNLAIPLLLYIVNAIIDESIINNYTSSYNEFESERVSPIGGILHIFYDFISQLADGNVQNGTANWLLWFTLFTFLYLIAAWRLFVKRQSENVSKPFAFPAVFYVFSAVIICLATLMISLEITSAAAALFSGLLINAVIFAVLMITYSRGLKNITGFKKKLIFFSVIFAVSLIIAPVSRSTFGFGKTYKVPNAGNVSSVYISCNSLQWDNNSNMTEFCDRNGIKKITSLHSILTSELKQNESRYVNGLHSFIEEANGIANMNSYDNPEIQTGQNVIQLRYSMKNGKTMDRVFITKLDIPDITSLKEYLNTETE